MLNDSKRISQNASNDSALLVDLKKASCVALTFFEGHLLPWNFVDQYVIYKST